MHRIGILSDTHGYLHPRIVNFFSEVDEIWHAGDIGDMQTAVVLNSIKPLRAVYGNIDGTAIRKVYPKTLSFMMEEVSVMITHIGGYPGKYDLFAAQMIEQLNPSLFISGHSHILKVMFDRKRNLLYINPGAAGKNGLHKAITAVRMKIEGRNMKDLEVIDIPRNREG